MEQWCAQLIVELQPNLFNDKKMGLFALQKCIATKRILTYGIANDAMDKYC
jgi:hypothetical protein